MPRAYLAQAAAPRLSSAPSENSDDSADSEDSDSEDSDSDSDGSASAAAPAGRHGASSLHGGDGLAPWQVLHV